MFKCDLCGHQQFKGGHHVVCDGCRQPYEFAGVDGYRIVLSPGQVMALRCAPMLPPDWIKYRMNEAFSMGLMAVEAAILLEQHGMTPEASVNIRASGRAAVEHMRKIINKVDIMLSDEVISQMHHKLEAKR